MQTLAKSVGNGVQWYYVPRSSDTMETYSHAQIAGMEKDNWWYVARRNLVDSLMTRFPPRGHEVGLDAGCGVGAHFPLLSKRATTVIGVDISQEALDQTHGAYGEKVRASVEEMSVADSSVDFAVCTDVLEHVDDTKAVAELRRVLKPGGVVYVTVPAFEMLWNENDDYAHHKRRYRKHELLALFMHEGFSIAYCNFWNRLFFVPVWLVAHTYTRGSKKEELKNNLSLVPAWLNEPLKMWMAIENAVARYIPFPFGVSLALVAVKNRD